MPRCFAVDGDPGTLAGNNKFCGLLILLVFEADLYMRNSPTLTHYAEPIPLA